MSSTLYPIVLIQCNITYNGIAILYSATQLVLSWGDGERREIDIEPIEKVMEQLQLDGLFEGSSIKAVVHPEIPGDLGLKLPPQHRSLFIYDRRDASLFVCSYETLRLKLNLPRTTILRDGQVIS